MSWCPRWAVSWTWSGSSDQRQFWDCIHCSVTSWSRFAGVVSTSRCVGLKPNSAGSNYDMEAISSFATVWLHFAGVVSTSHFVHLKLNVMRVHCVEVPHRDKKAFESPGLFSRQSYHVTRGGGDQNESLSSSVVLFSPCSNSQLWAKLSSNVSW